ncbi:MAG: PQQ-dependent sugar dehydrogenase, partial [Verrucomicrobiales bacterium]
MALIFLPLRYWVTPTAWLRFCFLFNFLLFINVIGGRAATLPEGFVEEEVGSGWNEAVGLVFGKNGDGTKDRAYVWEREGRVWIVEDGVKLATPLLDIGEEVGGWRDYGMLGMALDPHFQTNGYFYVLYVVDRHHLMSFGTASYHATTDDYYAATIGRVTRFTARRGDDFRSVDPASRKVLLGETKSTGFPILHMSHGTGSLVFGSDGTLLAACGDGANYEIVDSGGTTGGTHAPQAVADGIITAEENVGAFRCPMLDSLSGKIVRMDPATGDGVASNPFFQNGAPRSARSRIWATGLRNPLRMTLKPGSGEHDPAAGAPGVLMIGDVGWNSAEDLEVADGPGKNFGWPLYEGYNQNSAYWNVRPAGMDALDWVKPRSSWRVGAFALKPGGEVERFGLVGGTVPGPDFNGSCSVG